jgi:hypothetical protein
MGGMFRVIFFSLFLTAEKIKIIFSRQCDANDGDPPVGPGFQRPLEPEQYPNSRGLPFTIHQVRHLGYDRSVDLCRNGVFHFLLAQRGKHLPLVVINRSHNSLRRTIIRTALTSVRIVYLFHLCCDMIDRFHRALG